MASQFVRKRQDAERAGFELFYRNAGSTRGRCICLLIRSVYKVYNTLFQNNVRVLVVIKKKDTQRLTIYQGS